jgi:hypothetical protein
MNSPVEVQAALQLPSTLWLCGVGVGTTLNLSP